MGTKTEGEVGYETFDSRDFETDQSESVVETVSDESKASDDGDADPAESESEGAEGDGEGAGAEGETEAEAAAEGEPDESSEGGEKPAYEPNLKYRVYDEEREFPDWAKGLVKDKETEESFRSLLAKAEGLDEMKPRHQAVVSERDSYRSQNEALRSDLQRVVGLREKSPSLFFREIGVSDDYVVNYAKRIVNAQDTREDYDAFNRARAQEYDAYQARRAADSATADSARTVAQAVHDGISAGLTRPDVAEFASRYDSVHGEGAFQQRCFAHGNQFYQLNRRNLPPLQCVEEVFNYERKGFALGTPNQAGNAQTGASGGGAGGAPPAAAKPRAKPIPSVGKGRNVSPARRRYKSIAEMRAAAERLDVD